MYTIRPLQANDSLLELTDLVQSAYARFKDQSLDLQGVDQDLATSRQRLQNLHTCLIALDGNTMIASLSIHYPKPSRTSHWYSQQGVVKISQLAVRPAYQGQGLGCLLIELAGQIAKDIHGVKNLALDTAQEAKSLVNYYQSLGFEIKESLQWPGKTYWSYVLNKTL